MFDSLDNLSTEQKNIWQLMAHFLHKRNELCIGGMGRFASQHHEFSVDPVAKRIIPPYRKVYFQSGDFKTTTDFIEFVSSTLGITINQVKTDLAEFVNNFHQDLSSKRNLEIEKFGIFKFNVMGEPDFESIKELGFMDGSFGLPSIDFSNEVLKTKRMVVEKEVEEDEEVTQLRHSALKELKVLLDNARIVEANQPKKKSNLFPIVATVLTLVLLINLGFFLFKDSSGRINQQISQMNIMGNTVAMIDSQANNNQNVKTDFPLPENNTPIYDSIAIHFGKVYAKGDVYFDSTFYESQPNEVSTLAIESPIFVQENSSGSEPEINENSKKKTIESEEKVATIDNNTNHSYGRPIYKQPEMLSVDAQENGVEKGFYVIAGSFKNENYAKRLKEKLFQEGNTSALVVKPLTHPYYLVVFEKCVSLNNALNLIEKKQVEQPAVWIYCAF